jgi:ABC-type spermidine/putrescine transport system permease subunit II
MAQTPSARRVTGDDSPPAAKSGDRVLSLRVGEATVILSADADAKGYIAQEFTLDQLQRRNFAQDINLRRRFASYLLGIHAVVNTVVLGLVFLVALGKADLSEQVLITLIASTVAELAGLVLAVATYLFPAPKKGSAAG